MAKLTANQIALLHIGARTKDGVINLSQIKDRPIAALSAALGALKRKGLAEKVEGGCWRMTTAGRDAVGAVEAAGTASSPSYKAKQNTRRGQLLVLLQRKAGASMAEMTDAIGWQPHSVRALLSGIRKSGMTVDCTKQRTGSSRYHAVAASSAAQ